MMAVLASSLYASLRVAFRAGESASAAVDPTRRAEIALALVERDLYSAAVPKGILAGSFVGEDATDALGNQADRLTLHGVAPGGASGPGTGDIRKVEIACEAASDGSGQVLLRRVTGNLLSPQVVEPAEEILCRGVRAFGLRYFDGADWRDDWDSGAQDNVLPLAVEVVVELQTDRPTRQGDGYRLSRVIRIPCGTAASETTVVVGR